MNIESNKVLTIDPIWVWAIFEGLKLVENRTWSTKHRGQLWIHASQNKRREREAREWFARHTCYEPPASDRLSAVAGRLYGSVNLVDCVAIEELPESEREFAIGPICWRLSDPQRFVAPIPVQGKQGLWTLPESLIAGVN